MRVELQQRLRNRVDLRNLIERQTRASDPTAARYTRKRIIQLVRAGTPVYAKAGPRIVSTTLRAPERQQRRKVSVALGVGRHGACIRSRHGIHKSFE